MGTNVKPEESTPAVCNAVASVRKPRSRRSKKDSVPKRLAFSQFQLDQLNLKFQVNTYIDYNRREAMAKSIGLTGTQVRIWFQNRRSKLKKGMTGCKCPTEKHTHWRQCAIDIAPNQTQTVLSLDKYVSDKYVQIPQSSPVSSTSSHQYSLQSATPQQLSPASSVSNEQFSPRSENSESSVDVENIHHEIKTEEISDIYSKCSLDFQTQDDFVVSESNPSPEVAIYGNDEQFLAHSSPVPRHVPSPTDSASHMESLYMASHGAINRQDKLRDLLHYTGVLQSSHTEY